jgi:hypothetical protein
LLKIITLQFQLMRLIYRTPQFLIIILLLLGTCTLHAQSKRAYIKAGDKAFEKKDYSAAFIYYGEAVTKAATDISVQMKYAESAMKLMAFNTAEKTYQSILENKTGEKKYPLALYRMGEINKTNGKYQDAQDYFSRFRNTLTDQDTVWAAKTASQEVACQWAMNYRNTNTPTEIIHFDRKINSPYSDFAPTLKGDSLFFSSLRFEKKAGKQYTKERTTRLMMSVGGKSAREPLRGIPASDSTHVAHAAFTPNGKFLIFNFCKNINAFDIRCELWMITQDRKGHWTKPQKLPQPINLSGFTSTQPSIAYDGGTGQLRLWFASDRPGGKGGLDIWSVPLDTAWFCPCNLPLEARRPQRLPEFDQPSPLVAVNTPENDATPFYHTPSGTLYFSSEGWPGFGGYDVFKSRDNKRKFTEPENAGQPINSSYNDVYYTQTPDGKNGYISSNRPGAFYLDERNKACCNDIFAIKIPEENPPANIPQLVTKAPELPAPIPAIKVDTPQQFIDFVGLPLFFDNDEPDKKTRKTFTSKTYEETVLAYLDRQDEYRRRRTEGLITAAADKEEAAVDAFFDNEVRQGYDRLGQLCELLLTRLTQGQTVEIFIKGFTSPRAQSDYNINLGKRRISSVRNHIAHWSDGALEQFIYNGQLRITETSFGETTARLGLSDDLKDERNSIYAPDASRERRVEIVDITAK